MTIWSIIYQRVQHVLYAVINVVLYHRICELFCDFFFHFLSIEKWKWTNSIQSFIYYNFIKLQLVRAYGRSLSHEPFPLSWLLTNMFKKNLTTFRDVIIMKWCCRHYGQQQQHEFKLSVYFKLMKHNGTETWRKYLNF